MKNCLEKNPGRHSEIWRWVTVHFCSLECRTTTKRQRMWGQWQLKPSCFSSHDTPQFKNYGENRPWLRRRESQLRWLSKEPHISQMPDWTGPQYTARYVKQKINQCYTHDVCFVNRVILIKFMVTLQDHKTSQRGLR